MFSFIAASLSLNVMLALYKWLSGTTFNKDRAVKHSKYPQIMCVKDEYIFRGNIGLHQEINITVNIFMSSVNHSAGAALVIPINLSRKGKLMLLEFGMNLQFRLHNDVYIDGFFLI